MSSGNVSLNLPIVRLYPLLSAIYSQHFSIIYFCTGGRYSDTIVMDTIIRGMTIINPAIFAIRLFGLLFSSICYKVTKKG